MSFQAIRWAEAQKTGDKTSKAVLVALAGFADAEGWAWPSQLAIAEKCEMSVRSVRYAMQRLEALNFILRERRGCSRRRARITDMIWVPVPSKSKEQTGTLTGKQRQPYRQELPRNLSVNHREEPSQEEKLFTGSSKLVTTHEASSNIVAFPGVDLDHPFGRDVA